MSKIIIALFTICFLMANGVALSQTDPKAQAVLQALTNKIKTYKGIEASFSYQLKNTATGDVNNINGNIAIKKEKYFLKNGSTEILFDGSKTYTYNGIDQVLVSSDNNNKTLGPQKLLTNFYDKDFVYTLVRSDEKEYQIKFSPIDKRKNFKQAQLFIRKKELMVYKAIITDINDNEIRFNLTKINTHANIPDKRFVFDPSRYGKEVEIINQ